MRIKDTTIEQFKEIEKLETPNLSLTLSEGIVNNAVFGKKEIVVETLEYRKQKKNSNVFFRKRTGSLFFFNN